MVAASLRALALTLVLGLAACGGSGKPKKKLVPGTLTVGAVVVSPRDRVIARGARIDVGEINSVGGIAGKVPVRFITGPDARSLVRRGAKAVLLPCEPAAQASAERVLRGRNVFVLATCNSLAPTSAWGAGPSLDDRAAALAATVHDRKVDKVSLLASRGANAVLRKELAARDIAITAPAGAVVTDAGWGQLDGEPLRALYGLDRLDSAAGRRASRSRRTATRCREASWTSSTRSTVSTMAPAPTAARCSSATTRCA
jgi:hypothetical protein